MKKGQKRLDNARPVFDEKTENEYNKTFKKLCYVELFVKGIIYFLLGILVAYALKRL